MIDMPAPKDILIAPSLLSADFAFLGDEVKKLDDKFEKLEEMEK